MGGQLCYRETVLRHNFCASSLTRHCGSQSKPHAVWLLAMKQRVYVALNNREKRHYSVASIQCRDGTRSTATTYSLLAALYPCQIYMPKLKSKDLVEWTAAMTVLRKDVARVACWIAPTR